MWSKSEYCRYYGHTHLENADHYQQVDVYYEVSFDMILRRYSFFAWNNHALGEKV